MSRLAITLMSVIVAALVVASYDTQKHGLFVDDGAVAAIR